MRSGPPSGTPRTWARSSPRGGAPVPYLPGALGTLATTAGLPAIRATVGRLRGDTVIACRTAVQAWGAGARAGGPTQAWTRSTGGRLPMRDDGIACALAEADRPPAPAGRKVGAATCATTAWDRGTTDKDGRLTGRLRRPREGAGRYPPVGRQLGLPPGSSNHRSTAPLRVDKRL
jgi:hypothetical protein